MSKAAELASLIGNINAGGGGVNRNVIINGAMNVAQRGTSSTGIGGSSGYFTIDRFRLACNTSGRLTMSQDSSVPSGKGFANSLKLACTTTDTSLGADELLTLNTKLEGQNLQGFSKGTSDAKPFAVSFYCKANASATYVLEMQDKDNDRQISKSFNVTSDWTKVTLNFPADTTGAFDDDNAESMQFQVWLNAGSTYTSGTINSSAWASTTNANRVGSGTTNFFDSTARTFFITGLQLEVGQNPTEFEHEPFDVTFRKCQRYLEIWSDVDSFNAHPAAGYNNLYKAWLPFHTQKRTDPTVSTYGVGGYPNNAGYTDTDGVGNDAVSYSRISKHGFHISGVASPYSFACAMSADAEL